MSTNFSDESVVFVGTYTFNGSEGMYRFRFNTTSGVLTPDGVAATMPNPTFLCLHPNGRFLYTVSEVRDFGARKNGSVNAFTVENGTGRLRHLNIQPSGGAGPCHVRVDHTGRNVLVANYAAGSVAIFPIGADGHLAEATDIIQHHGASINPERQTGPHAHSITPSPDNRYALVADLGLDRIMVYRMDVAAGRLIPNDPPWAQVAPGAGPRHIVFHPNRPLVYVITELGNSLITFAWDARNGSLTELATMSTLPADFNGKSYAAEIAMDITGRFLYGSNRGHDSIALFEIDGATGHAKPLTHEPTLGQCPRHFVIHPSGHWLLVANQDGNSIVVFRRNPATGRLTPAGTTATVSMPVCLAFA